MKKKILLCILCSTIIFSFNASSYAYAAPKIGDVIQLGQYNDKAIKWIVIHIDRDGDPLLLSDRILTYKAFDVTGNYHQSELRQKYGSNYWQDSNIRQWLNSDKRQIDWIQNPPTEDNLRFSFFLDYAYEKEPGFLSDPNFTKAERNAIKSSTHKVLLSQADLDKRDGGEEGHQFHEDIDQVMQNYDTSYYQLVTDRVFLLSVQELHDYIYKNGWPHTARPVDGLLLPGSGTGGWWPYWLRDSVFYSESQPRFVLHLGSINGNADSGWNNHYLLSNTNGIRPAFYLNWSSVQSKTGVGIGSDPFVFELKSPPQLNIDIQHQEPITLVVGENETLNIDTPIEEIHFYFQSSDKEVAEISPDGTITAIGPGVATLYIEATHDSYEDYFVSIEVMVEGEISIEEEILRNDSRNNRGNLQDKKIVLISVSICIVVVSFLFIKKFRRKK
ncbi:hypothetical protein J2T56_001348 [Natronobacillus azotifigens]|uniref:DUF6273 domain-containing protein n=1 Tax=Natronobacillus azotifigens TaxID=472978 RepID=A0A9J6RCQ9_9BACI|nr:DUF6273 domain-containing protein [Natronobacillus azotifigens]MCZ0703084.1 DUF6273 domain-containing protein [Natronobacillus azotifigens]